MWRIGHRGAAGLVAENTIASMQKALDLGMDGFEFDIRLSKDGVPVVIHDDSLERTTNGTGLIRDYSFVELQKLDAGKGQKISSLSEVIEFAGKRCILFIELKDDDATKPVVDIITESVKNGWRYDQLYVLSFNHRQLLEVKNLNPEILTCASLVAIPVNLAEIAVQAGAQAIGPALDHCNQELIDDAHKRDLKVLVWTVNKPRSIERARLMNVDGIISDFPDRL